LRRFSAGSVALSHSVGTIGNAARQTPERTSKMLKKIAAGLIAASMLTAPMLVAGTAAAATPKAATATKASVKTVKAQRKHARIVVRHGVRYMKVVRHGKIAWVKVRTGKHHIKHVKKTIRPATAKPGAA
jgi:hypothetical protein